MHLIWRHAGEGDLLPNLEAFFMKTVDENLSDLILDLIKSRWWLDDQLITS